MSQPSQPGPPTKPSTEDLAGIPVLVDGPVDTTRGLYRGAIPLLPIPPGYRPTVEDLAGTPVLVEGPEDKTVRPYGRPLPTFSPQEDHRKGCVGASANKRRLPADATAPPSWKRRSLAVGSAGLG